VLTAVCRKVTDVAEQVLLRLSEEEIKIRGQFQPLGENAASADDWVTTIAPKTGVNESITRKCTHCRFDHR
jgi:hypothetical protein